MRKTLALLLLALVPAVAGAASSFDQTTYFYSGTKTAAVFQQYCYTNGALCVIRNAAAQVVEPAELVRRLPGVTNTFSCISRPRGMVLTGWTMGVCTEQTIAANPPLPATLDRLNPAWTGTAEESVSFVGSGVSGFLHWDRYLLIAPCFAWLTYDLVYERNDGSGATRRDPLSHHTYTNEITVANCPWTRKGHDFTGWALTPDGPAAVTAGAQVTGADLGAVTNGILRLYATWEKRDLLLRLDPGEGTVAVTSITARIDEPITLPTPVRENYDFQGWFTDPNGVNPIADGDLLTRDDLDCLYAQWMVRTATISLGTATPYGGSVSPTGDQIVACGEHLTIEATAYDGYRFAGWSDGVTAATREVTVEADGVYWARFEPLALLPEPIEPEPPSDSAATRTVYFLANGGQGAMAPQIVAAGTEVRLQANTFTRLDGDFLGWATDPDAAPDAIAYADEALVTAFPDDGYLVLHALWDVHPPEPDPPAPGEPVDVTLTSESGWATETVDDETVWRDSQPFSCPVLTGTVNSAGTVTFGWKGELFFGLENENGTPLCDFCTNDVTVATLIVDGTWHEVTVPVEAATKLSWRRTTDKQIAVLRRVVWTPAAPVEPDPGPDPEPMLVTAFVHVRAPLVYDGTEQTGVVAIGGCTVEENAATAAGTHTARARLQEGAVWADGATNAERQVTWTIAKATYDLSGIAFADATFLADGTAKSLAITGSLPDGVTVTYEGNGQSRVGRSVVTARFTGETVNHEPIPDRAAILTILPRNIEPGDGELPAGALSVFDMTAAYDGTAKTLDGAAIRAAFADELVDGTVVRYATDASAREVDWSDEPPTQTDAGTLPVWYRVETIGRGRVTHAAKITVTPRNLALVTIEPIADQTWDGTPARPVVQLTDTLPQVLTEADYTITYADNAAVGTATVTLTGRGNYTGTVTTTFTILPPPYDLSNIRLDDATFFADGQPKSLTLTGTLPEGVSVSYSGNGRTEPGAYTVTAFLMGAGHQQPLLVLTATLTLTEFVQARQLEPFVAALTELGVPTVGEKATVKAEGLPSGLKLAKTATGWTVTGTPKETLDGVTRRAYVRVTENKVQMIYFLRLCVLPAAAEWIDPVGTAVTRDLPDATAASGLPSGIRFKAGVCSGTPTKPGVFTVTVTGPDRRKRQFFWTIKPTVTPTCVVQLDAALPQERTRTILRQGVAYAWPIAATEGATVSVAGLPGGLKLIKTPVKENGKVIRTDLSLGGVPTKAGDFVATIKTKLGGVTTVTTEAFAVEPLSAWAVGTFNGGGDDGLVTLTVSPVGKLTGKWQSEGLTWTLSAPSFAAYEEATEIYTAELVMQAGKSVVTNAVTLAAGTTGGEIDGGLFTARQNRWKQEPWKTAGKAFSKADAVDYAPHGRLQDAVSLKVAASGAVTAKGSFVTGENPRTGAPVRYSASCATTLCPLLAPDGDGCFPAQVIVHFPPVAGKFPNGYTACVDLYWLGSSFVLIGLEESLP